MRRLFVLLLLANLVFAGWSLLSTSAPAPRPQLSDAELAYAARLQLASEYSPPPEPAPSAPESEPEAPEAGAAAAGGEAAELAADAPGPAAGDRAQETVVEAETAAPATEAGAAPPDDAPPADAAAAMPAEVAPAAEPSPPPPRYCVRIGPLGDDAAATRLQGRIGAWISEARVTPAEIPERRTYWVHVPPRASAAEAQAVVQALAARRVESFVIRDEPDLRNGVSLGVFRDEESARTHRERLRDIGYPVAIRERVRTRRAYFLVAVLLPGAPEGGSPELRSSVAAAAPAARLEGVPCDDIAAATVSD